MLKSNFDRWNDPGSLFRLPGFHICNEDKPAFAMIRVLIAIPVIALAMAVFMMPSNVCADSSGYTTDAFDVNVVTDEDHTFHVTEEIQVDFYEYRYGIYRYIPDGGRYYGISNVRVDGYQYETYMESGNEVVQIGSPDYTVYGPQTYRISYDIVGYKDDDGSRDMLSLDLLPTGWGTAIDSASLRIEFPKEIDDIMTYVGSYGSENQEGYFDITNTGTVYTAVSKEQVPRGVGLTISADLPEGYWVNPYSREDKKHLLAGVLAVMGMLMLLLWAVVGRDDPVIRTVEFYPPEDMDPLEIAYVANDDVQSKDISSVFMYLANKGCLSIREEGKKLFSLVKKQNPPLSEPDHISQIYHSVFSESKRVDLRDLPEGFGEVAAGIPSAVKKSVESRKPAFSSVSKAARMLGLAFCLLIPLVAGVGVTYLTYGDGVPAFFGSVILGVVMCVSMVSLVAKTDAFRSRKRPVRMIISGLFFLAAVLVETALLYNYEPLLALIFAAAELAAGVATIFVRRRMNNELYGRVLGFRDFIRTAEYDRLKMLSDEDPSYYFNIMPYACVFGMSTKWADKFSDFKIPQPSWYYSETGVWDPFFPRYMFYYSGNSISSSVADHYKAVGAGMLSNAVDSASSGGFGGGGFSGGGFGGGGGGSW